MSTRPRASSRGRASGAAGRRPRGAAAERFGARHRRADPEAARDVVRRRDDAPPVRVAADDERHARSSGCSSSSTAAKNASRSRCATIIDRQGRPHRPAGVIIVHDDDQGALDRTEPGARPGGARQAAQNPAAAKCIQGAVQLRDQVDDCEARPRPRERWRSARRRSRSGSPSSRSRREEARRAEDDAGRQLERSLFAEADAELGVRTRRRLLARPRSQRGRADRLALELDRERHGRSRRRRVALRSTSTFGCVHVRCPCRSSGRS